jgi:proton-translocating NADH-quinone oxidoreductase chain M
MFENFSNDGKLLIILKLLPLMTSLIIAMISSSKTLIIGNIALIGSLITWLCNLILLIGFDSTSADFQYGYHIESVGTLFHFSLGFGVDGLNLWLLLLTTCLIPISILVGWTTPFIKSYCLILLILETILLIAFSARDVLVFYLFFEAVLMPMFLLIGLFGSQPRHIRAAYKMFITTLIGSFPMLIGIWILHFQCGSTDWSILNTSFISPNRQLVLWLCWFVSFAVKTPLVPFHSWLPEAHTNASAGGSIILAGILLKLGTYGFLRWSLPLTPLASIYFSPFIYLLSLIGIIFISLATLRQTDIKKIIAYSSIAHMSYCVLALFSFNIYGLEGALLMMIGHGLVSPALFMCAGIIYDRYKTRNIYYFGGLAQTMPLFSSAFFILTMANISLPIISPTFAAEFLTLVSMWFVSKIVTISAAISMLFTSAYSLLLFARLTFGQIKLIYISKHSDLNR